MLLHAFLIALSILPSAPWQRRFTHDGVSFPTAGWGRIQGAPCDLLAVYAYDGVGRLAYQRRALEQGQTTPPRVDYYYDGVRRIAERVFSPYAAPQQWPPGCQPCDANCDGSINPFDIQPFIDLVSGGPPCSVCAGDTNYDGTTNAFDIGNFTACIVDPVLGTESQREYVYGPEYVDELVCQIPVGGVSPANFVYYLQDANYNVTGLMGAAPSGGGAAPVLTQYIYEPYGQVLTIDAVEPESQPYNTVANQGLFFEAFGAPWMGESPLQPMAPGLYYNRNRWYSPALGRFTSKDPNASSAPIAAAMTLNGQQPGTLLDEFDPKRHYANGLTLYTPYGSNPISRRDTAGLDWGYDSDIDDAMRDYGMDIMGAVARIEDARGQIFNGTIQSALYPAAAFLWDELVWNEGEAALYGLATGGFFASACLEAGTSVLLADGTCMPIECIDVGSRVASSELAPSTTGTPPTIAPDLWRLVRLEVDDVQHCRTITITLLRPLQWLKDTNATKGRIISLSLPEIGLNSNANVISIEPCPLQAAGSLDAVVTGIVATSPVNTISVYVDGTLEPIGITPSHLLYSLDRNDWVPAGKLIVGERLLTFQGDATVVAVDRQTKPQTVWNLEVLRGHVYCVSPALLYAHNACALAEAAMKFRVRGAAIIDGLREATHQAIAKVFNGSVFRASGHFIARCKDVRAYNLGVRTFQDIEAIVRSGRYVIEDGGKYIHFIGNNMRIIADARTGSLVTLKPN